MKTIYETKILEKYITKFSGTSPLRSKSQSDNRYLTIYSYIVKSERSLAEVQKIFKEIINENENEINFLNDLQDDLSEELNILKRHKRDLHKDYSDYVLKTAIIKCRRVLKEIDNKIQALGKALYHKEIFQIEWNGTQKELGELFVELKNNGWIDDWDYDTIKACFTKSKTIHQILKPSTDKSTYEEHFEQIYTDNYKPKFYGISPIKKVIKRNP